MKATLTTQKLRGGYYTPLVISDFLVRWAVQRGSDTVLEPSCGDGAFIESLIRRREQLGAHPSHGAVLAVELDEIEAAKSRARLSSAVSNGSVINTDFFQHCRDTLLPGGRWDALAPRYDVVVGNPPFIRYQSFPEAHRETAFEIMQGAGLHPNRLTNAWVPFLVCSAMALSPEGRLGMVIPAELLQVTYAAEVRRFLTDFFERITLITFQSLVFPEIQQEVVLLLAERKAGESRGMRTVELAGAADLEWFDFFESLNGQLKPVDHSKEKWTKYFLPQREISLLRRMRGTDGVFRVEDFAEVDVGVVTGENDFFMLKPSDARALRIDGVTARAISKSGQLAGLDLREHDWQALIRDDSRVLLFLPQRERLSASARAYIKAGEKKGQNAGYKCSIRQPWYIVPSVWIPDAFGLRQVHRFPKIILNHADATATDTVHRLRFRSGVDGRQVAMAFVNSMTFAFAEVMGRSYGGGVLTFEPSELEDLPIPIVGAEALDFQFIDEKLRAGDIYAVLNHTDEILLRRNLGLDESEVACLRSAWERLRDRRTSRRTRTRQLDLLAPPTPLAGRVTPENDAVYAVAATSS